MIDGYKTNSFIEAILCHDHVSIGIYQLHMEQYFVLVVEVLVVEVLMVVRFLCHF